MAEPTAKEMLVAALEEMSDAGDLGHMEAALDPLTAFLQEFAAPGFVCVMQPIPPTAPITYPGVEGVWKGWRDYGEAFESVRADLEEIRESRGHVVVLVDQIVTTRHGGVEMNQPSAMVFAFEADRVARLEFHLDQSAALRVAGLDP
jgi:ketosteroid isomerase-like protein